jgi:hypothetical protein
VLAAGEHLDLRLTVRDHDELAQRRDPLQWSNFSPRS